MSEAPKCPCCKVTIEPGQTLCGNCKTKIVWKNSVPSADIPQAISRAGNSLLSFAFWLFLLAMALTFWSCGRD